jgi:hypothetical protein
LLVVWPVGLLLTAASTPVTFLLRVVSAPCMQGSAPISNSRCMRPALHQQCGGGLGVVPHQSERGITLPRHTAALCWHHHVATSSTRTPTPTYTHGILLAT